jgi:hypothetical protein
MISTLFRKARTLFDTFHDFQREPLASFQALEKGLEDRRLPVPPELAARVRAAYLAAKRDQQSAGVQYQANGEWTKPIEAKFNVLSDGAAIGDVLQSFFRHEDVFFGLTDYSTPPYLRSRRRLMTRVLFVNSMLHDYRVWSELTGEKIKTVGLPLAGNPFGYFIEDTLAIPATFRHHYMAEKAVGLMGGKGVLAEIGGGWGDVGFFALRSQGVHYLDIDLPETLLLAAYWLCSVLPDRKIVLYGEQDSKTVLSNLEKYDAVLFPNFCLPLLPDNSTDVFINARSLSEMNRDTVHEYLAQIARTCRRYFLHENNDTTFHKLGHDEVKASSFSIEKFRLLNKTLSPWKAGGGRYREFLYERAAA